MNFSIGRVGNRSRRVSGSKESEKDSTTRTGGALMIVQDLIKTQLVIG